MADAAGADIGDRTGTGDVLGTQPIEGLFTAFMSPNNEVRRRAEAAWEEMKAESPDEVLESVCDVLGRGDVEAEDDTPRVMAAVLCRSLFDVHFNVWSRAQECTRAGVKTTLLDRLVKEPVSHIRRKIIHAIGQLAAASHPVPKWPGLVALSMELCSAEREATPEMRIVGLDLVRTLSESCPLMISPNREEFLKLLRACLGDEIVGVRVASLKATSVLLQDPLPSALAPTVYAMVPEMMSILKATVMSGDEVAASYVLEALDVAAAKQPLLFLVGPHNGLEVVGDTMVSIAACTSLEESTRDLAMELVTTLCESAPSVWRQGGVDTVSPLLELTMRLLVQPPEGSDEELQAWLSVAERGKVGEGGDSEEGYLFNSAAGTLHRIAESLEGPAVLSTIMPVCSELVADDSNWRRRKAGFFALLLSGEGCAAEMARSEILEGIIVGPVMAGMRDPHPRVRYSALECVGAMPDDLSEWDGGGEGCFQGAFHTQLLPALVESLSGLNAGMPRLEAAATRALVSFCNPERMQARWLNTVSQSTEEGEGEDESVGESLLRSLADLASSSPSVVVREEALAAIGSIGNIMGPDFEPFYDTFISLAKEIIEATAPPKGGNGGGVDAGRTETLLGLLTDDTDLLRGKAMELIALIGIAVDEDLFREDGHQMALLILDEQRTAGRDPGSTQASYSRETLSRIAGVLGEEFLPYLEEAVTPAFTVLSMGTELTPSSASDVDLATDEVEDLGLSAVTMGMGVAGRQVFGVSTSLMQAKESSCKALYQYAEDLGEWFAPYAAEALAAVLPNLGPRNTSSVQDVSAAILPKLVALADDRAAEEMKGIAGSAAALVPAVAEAQSMLDASVDALTELISRVGRNNGSSGMELASRLGGTSDDNEEGGDQERASLITESLGRVLEGRCGGGHDEEESFLCMTDERLSRTTTVLRDAAAASIQRSKVRAEGVEGGQGEMVGAVDEALLPDLEQEEENLLASVADAICAIVKGRKDTFLPTYESIMKPLVFPLLSESSDLVPPLHRHFAIYTAIDMLEHAGEEGRKCVFPEPLLPALMQGCREPTTKPSTRQACAYGLGVAADFGGPDFDEYCAEAFQLLLTLIAEGGEDDNDDDGDAPVDDDDGDGDYGWQADAVTDNAISAAFRVLLARHGPVSAAFSDDAGAGDSVDPISEIVGYLLGALPMKIDVAEGQVCHRKVVDLTLSRHKLFFGERTSDSRLGSSAAVTSPNTSEAEIIPKLVTAIAGMLEYQPSRAEIEEVAATEGVEGLQRLEWPGVGDGADATENADDEEMWERQLVDRDTQQKAQEALALLKATFPTCFEEAWAGLGDERRRALKL